MHTDYSITTSTACINLFMWSPLNLTVVITLGETVSFRVIWKKNNYDVTFGLDKKASQLKEHIQTLTGTNICI